MFSFSITAKRLTAGMVYIWNHPALAWRVHDLGGLGYHVAVTGLGELCAWSSLAALASLGLT